MRLSGTVPHGLLEAGTHSTLRSFTGEYFDPQALGRFLITLEEGQLWLSELGENTTAISGALLGRFEKDRATGELFFVSRHGVARRVGPLPE